MKRIFAIFILVSCVLSCSRTDVIVAPAVDKGLIPLTVTVTRCPDSKTYVTEDDKVYWQDADRVAVFDGTDKREFSIVSHSGSSAVFTGLVSETATSLTAVYPFDAALKLNEDGTVTVTLPSVQKASTTGSDPSALLSIARSSVAEGHFAFKNIISLAKIEITQDGISSVSLRPSSPRQIAGVAKVAVSGAVDSLAIGSTADYCVSLQAEGQYLPKGKYLLALLPSVFADGLVIEMKGENGTAVKKSGNSANFKRSGIIGLGDICTGAVWKADPCIKGSSVKILCLGNSFSEDALEGYLYDIFKGEGIEAVIGNGYVGGCDLATHWDNADKNTAAYSYRKIVGGERTVTSGKTVQNMLTDESWDYIVMQQGGGDQGFYSTYEPYLTNLLAYCRDKALDKSFKTVFYCNWAAAKDCDNAKFAKYGNDQMTMYRAIVGACATADSVHHFDIVSNVGDAIQSGRTSFLGDSWNRDGWHLKKTYGRYCASCVFYEKLTGKSCIGIKYRPETISDCVATLCQNCAHCAALFPYRYADMSWYRNTEPDPSLKVRIVAKWLFDKTVSVAAGHQASWTGSSVPLGTQATSNAPGLVGYMDANAEGSGRISFYQIDKTGMKEEKAARYILNGDPGGQPAVCGQMGGDYWLFETGSGDSFSEGDHLQASFTVYPGNYGAMYWMLEYLDGEQWVSVYPKKSKDLGIKTGIDVNSFDYNIALSTKNKFDCVVDARLTSQTPVFKIRLTCCSTYQVNGKYWTHPRNASEFRIAGTAADENLPVIKLLYE